MAAPLYLISCMPALTMPASTTYQRFLRAQVQLLAIPAFSDNYIWMVCKDDHAVVVDPGQAKPVDTILTENGLHLEAILLTHHHHDHVGGVTELQQAHTSAVIYGPATETLPACDHGLAQGDELALNGVALSLKVLDVPGHTAAHIA